MPYELDAKFPTAVPVGEIKAIIDIVRNGAQSQYRETLGRAGWWVVGYGAGLLLKDAAVLGATPSSECNEEECCVVNELAATLGVDANVATVCDSTITSATAFDPSLWLEIIRLILSMLKDLPKE